MFLFYKTALVAECLQHPLDRDLGWPILTLDGQICQSVEGMSLFDQVAQDLAGIALFEERTVVAPRRAAQEYLQISP